jgi:hypothetical protein
VVIWVERSSRWGMKEVSRDLGDVDESNSEEGEWLGAVIVHVVEAAGLEVNRGGPVDNGLKLVHSKVRLLIGALPMLFRWSKWPLLEFIWSKLRLRKRFGDKRLGDTWPRFVLGSESPKLGKCGGLESFSKAAKERKREYLRGLTKPTSDLHDPR